MLGNLSCDKDAISSMVMIPVSSATLQARVSFSFDLSANYLLKFLWLNRFGVLPMVTENSESETTVVDRL